MGVSINKSGVASCLWKASQGSRCPLMPVFPLCAAVAARGRSGTQDTGAPRPCHELTSNPCLIRTNRAQGPNILG